MDGKLIWFSKTFTHLAGAEEEDCNVSVQHYSFTACYTA